MTCSCTPCSECKGSGTVFYSFSGDYLGNNHRMDDMDELAVYEECGGTRIENMCDECCKRELEMDGREEFEFHNLSLTPKQRQEVREIVYSILNEIKV